MAGNVWEWVQDWYHSSYAGAPTDGSAWESPTGSNQVVRGGGMGSDAYALRAADRYDGVPWVTNYDLGRYMDDMLVFGPSKAGLGEVAEAVSMLLTEELRLCLKRRATVLAPVTEGVGWLGFRVHPGTTRLDRQGRRRFSRKVRRLDGRAGRSPLAEERIVAVAPSVCGHLAQADTHGLWRSLLDDRERG